MRFGEPEPPTSSASAFRADTNPAGMFPTSPPRVRSRAGATVTVWSVRRNAASVERGTLGGRGTPPSARERARPVIALEQVQAEELVVEVVHHGAPMIASPGLGAVLVVREYQEERQDMAAGLGHLVAWGTRHLVGTSCVVAAVVVHLEHRVVLLRDEQDGAAIAEFVHWCDREHVH